MNKIVIPTLLVATVMVAGMFAFVPVEQASTVHTSASTLLGTNSITAASITDGSIDTVEFAADFLDNTLIADNAFDTEQFAVDFLTAALIENAAIDANTYNADVPTLFNDGSLGSSIQTFFTTNLNGETNNDITATSNEDFIACISVSNNTAADGTLTVTNNLNAVVFDVYEAHGFNAGCFAGAAGTEITFGSDIALDAHATLIAEEDATTKTLVGNT